MRKIREIDKDTDAGETDYIDSEEKDENLEKGQNVSENPTGAKNTTDRYTDRMQGRDRSWEKVWQ